MYHCNDFNVLSVLSLYEGELIGKVNKLYFDKDLKKLVSINIISEDGISLSLNTKNIYHIGKNAITVKNNQAVNVNTDMSELTTCPIGSKAYSIQGTYLGLITEITLNNKFKVEKFSLDNDHVIDVKFLASSGKNAVIFYEENKKMDIKKFNPITSPKEIQVEVATEVNVLPVEKPVNQTNKKPMQPSAFLIGRICHKDIFNFNNELLIKAHSVINKKNLKEVEKYGKLRELMLYSK